jgi:hypothetical protein
MTSVIEIERNLKTKARHDVHQEGGVCLVCWDLLISFYFYNRCHDVRYNGHILCACVAPALSSLTCEMCYDNEEAALNAVLPFDSSWLKSS